MVAMETWYLLDQVGIVAIVLVTKSTLLRGILH